jgi:hypothetical protein
MKRHSGGKSANMYVMFGLLAVLFVSLGYLSMQGKREGLTAPAPAPAKKAGFKGGREGMAGAEQAAKKKV